MSSPPAEQPAGGRASGPLLIEGELTIHTAGDRKAEILALLESGDAPVVDLSGVTELDTAGLQLLLFARREAAQLGRTLEVAAVSAAVEDALAIVKLGPTLTPITPAGATR